MICADGSKFSGNFENGIWSGLGEYTLVDGVSFRGTWTDHELVANPEVKFKDDWKPIDFKGDIIDLDKLGAKEL